MNKQLSIDNPEIFFDRELSWLDFNYRVLEEAADPVNPILERLKFLCITESNLDEFYMVRVAGLRGILMSGNDGKSLNGMRYSEVFQRISKKVSQFVEAQYEILINSILPELKEKRINIIEDPALLLEEEIHHIQRYYKEQVSSVLTPLAIDTSHPFPHILNKTLNLAISLSNENDPREARKSLAVVQVPSVLPRFLQLPQNNGDRRFFPLEGIIKLHLGDLFYGMIVHEVHPFKIIRDSDMDLSDDVTDDLLSSVKLELKNRIWGEAVRLDINHNASQILRQILQFSLKIKEHEIFPIPHLLSLSDLMYFYDLSDTANLKFNYLKPRTGLKFESMNKIFRMIRKEDIMLHHPYDSFQEVENFLKMASTDPKVLGIKMTLYRTSGGSPIIEYLKQAAENGKQVTVLVELKARFDEERNIQWAQKLEDSGVHVVYGFIGLKIHCKLILVVRREDMKINRYVHLSTGNYNSTTARFYTDISLFTNNEEITEDAGFLFNAITGFAKLPRLKQLSVAPYYLKDDMLRFVKQEMENAKEGKEARIIMKMNSLVDPDLIVALYQASVEGVKIELVIRGICCLKPGIPGLSENISVRSIVGRLLEHSRIYIFWNGGDHRIFLASADCMPRNFNKRFETMFPILDKGIQSKILNIMELQLKDNVKARLLNPDGSYTKLVPGESIPVDSQTAMVELNEELSKVETI
ncbi:MAG: polyphosphate kinase 1 [Leptospiraceae bacterium]|nr:polyphosphate kinase 1 [Leptospiraceae bacterium]